MESKKTGVFSPSDNMDSASMIKCLQALLYDYPTIKFNSVTIDKKYNGFKIFFTEPDNSVVLAKNMLSSDEQPVWIYPLTTYLIILNVDHKKTPLFERDLRDVINKKLGRVIDVVKTDSSRYLKNWRIEIDMPEFKGLEAFKNSNFSEMTLSIRNEDVVLQFWCRQCENCGHLQHECLAREKKHNNISPKMKEEENNSNIDQASENSSAQDSLATDRHCERTPQRISRVLLEATEKYAEKIGKEEVMSKHIQNSFDEKTDKSVNNNLPIDKIIKQEEIEFPADNNTGGNKIPGYKEFENPENKNNSKVTIQENSDMTNRSQDSYSDDDDDDIRIIDQTDNSLLNKSPSHAFNSSATGKTFTNYFSTTYEINFLFVIF